MELFYIVFRATNAMEGNTYLGNLTLLNPMKHLKCLSWQKCSNAERNLGVDWRVQRYFKITEH